jgi:hypothetical protein
LPLDPPAGPLVDQIAGADQIGTDGELVEGVREPALLVGDLGGVGEK